MHSFEYILIMLVAVLLSALISQKLPMISTPLIQIALGIALALLPVFDFHVSLDSELFLVLFIAPLLFEDAKKADKASLWRLKRPILSMALVLVFATCLIVGYLLNLLTPAIPLAACFALAAALAPTDAVAVSSLKESASVDEEHQSILKGEALLNDASSIVAFQFAIGFALYSVFSPLQAVGTFAFMFFGGLALGAVLMLARTLLMRVLRAAGMENITFNVLFEVITPFLVFLIAEAVGVSGIIAVVAAGVMYSFSPKRTSPVNAKHNIVSSSVWSVITFTLNGLVFLILGTQLPNVTLSVWNASAADQNMLIIMVVFILLLILLIRFIWVLWLRRREPLASTGHDYEELEPATDKVSAVIAADFATEAADDGLGSEDVGHRPEVHVASQDVMLDPRSVRAKRAERDRKRQRFRLERSNRNYSKVHLRDALVLALTGVKGAISLALVLTIPLFLTSGEAFPERDLLLFLASGVIMLSLILGNILIPLVAPKVAEETTPDKELLAIIDIYRHVIHNLVETADPSEERITAELVLQYNERINSLKNTSELADPAEDNLRAQIINWERDNTLALIDDGKVNSFVGAMHIYQLSRILKRVEHHGEAAWTLQNIVDQFIHRLRETRQNRKHIKELKAQGLTVESRKETLLEIQNLQRENYNYVLDKLCQMPADANTPDRVISSLIADFQRRIERLDTLRQMREERKIRDAGGKRTGRAGRAGRIKQAVNATPEAREHYEEKYFELRMRGLQYERDSVDDALAHSRITRQTAKHLRDNIAMMELDIEDQLE